MTKLTDNSWLGKAWWVVTTNFKSAVFLFETFFVKSAFLFLGQQQPKLLFGLESLSYFVLCTIIQ